MVYFKEFQQGGRIYLSIIDAKDAPIELGRSFLIYRSLHRLKAMQVPTIEPSSFAQWISIRVKKCVDDGSKACYLQSVYHDKSNLITKFFMLGRQIIYKKAWWGPSLLLYGEFSYILPYCEWTEWVLACFDQCLRDYSCCLHLSLFVQLWCSCLVRFLWELVSHHQHPPHSIWRATDFFMGLHRLSGLLIYGQIFDETIPNSQIFNHWDKQGQRVIASSCGFLFAVLRFLEKAHSHDKGVTTKT